MNRFASLLLAALFAFAPLAHADLRAAGTGAPSGTYTQAQQLAAGIALRTPFLLAKSTIPIVVVSTGTMGNNGAMSAITALTQAYPNAFCVLPAGAVAAGVPAATSIYYCEFSSTTAATIYNVLIAATLDATGAPTVPTVKTAFATTGPGAFTGVTANVDTLTFTLPANALAARGELYCEVEFNYTNSATNKQAFVVFGGSNVLGVTQTTAVNPRALVSISNRGATNAQMGSVLFGTSTAASVLTPVFLAIDTTANVAVVVRVNHTGSATDNIVVERARFFVYSDGT